jgi:hypothetical protein
MKARNGAGAKGSDQADRGIETTGNRRTSMSTTSKPFHITKMQVYKAYKAGRLHESLDDKPEEC